jgi:hypothetical protein
LIHIRHPDDDWHRAGDEAEALLALSDGSLRFAPFCVVTEPDDDAQRSSIPLQRRRAEHDREETPILADEQIGVLTKFDSVLEHLETRAVAGRIGCAVGMFVVDDVVHLPAEQFGHGPAENDLRSRVHVRDETLHINGVHAGGNGMHGQPEALLAVTHQSLRSGQRAHRLVALQRVPEDVADRPQLADERRAPRDVPTRRDKRNGSSYFATHTQGNRGGRCNASLPKVLPFHRRFVGQIVHVCGKRDVAAQDLSEPPRVHLLRQHRRRRRYSRVAPGIGGGHRTTVMRQFEQRDAVDLQEFADACEALLHVRVDLFVRKADECLRQLEEKRLERHATKKGVFELLSFGDIANDYRELSPASSLM